MQETLPSLDHRHTSTCNCYGYSRIVTRDWQQVQPPTNETQEPKLKPCEDQASYNQTSNFCGHLSHPCPSWCVVPAYSSELLLPLMHDHLHASILANQRSPTTRHQPRKQSKDHFYWRHFIIFGRSLHFFYFTSCSESAEKLHAKDEKIDTAKTQRRIAALPSLFAKV